MDGAHDGTIPLGELTEECHHLDGCVAIQTRGRLCIAAVTAGMKKREDGSIEE